MQCPQAPVGAVLDDVRAAGGHVALRRDFRHFRIRRGELHLHDGSLSRAVGQRNPRGSAGGRDRPVLQPDYAAVSAGPGL